MIDRRLTIEMLFEKRGDRILVITQQLDDGRILGLHTTNQAAFRKTISTGVCHYYDEINDCVYLKGEHSGETEMIRTIRLDCCHARRHLFHLLYLVSMQPGQCKFGVSDCHFYLFDFSEKLFHFDTNLVVDSARVETYKNRIETVLDTESDKRHQRRFSKLP